MKYNSLLLALILLAVVPLFGISANGKVVRASDFGAIANDGKDDAEAIQKALAEAKRTGARKLIFDAGKYNLNTPDNSGNSYITVEGFDQFSVEGAVDGEGKPATELVRFNPLKNNYYPPHLLLFKECTNTSVSNLILTNSPYFYSAGVITEINASAPKPYIEVEILPGHPRVPDMGSFVMGAYDLQQRKLLVGRLTYGSIGNWQPVGGEGSRLMRLETEKWLEPDVYFRYNQANGILGKPLDGHLPVLQKGIALFWFQSYNNAKQVLARNCTDIVFNNMLTLNSSGFVFEAHDCKNVTIRKVDILPGDERIMMSQRDGFKIANCSGKVLVEDCSFEGVNDDLQNVHSIWYWVQSVSPDRKTVFFHRPMKSLKIGSKLGFFNDKTGGEDLRTVKSCKVDTVNKLLEVGLSRPLPEYVDNTVKAAPYCFLPDQYIIRNCKFRNIKGASIVLKAPKALIENNQFENVMNIAIQIGPRYDNRKPESEAGIAKNVVIRNNVFRNCGGFINRKETPPSGGWFFADPAAISLDIDEIDVKGAIKGVKIYNNRFVDLPTNGIFIRDARDIVLKNNSFTNVKGENLVIDPKTTERIKQ